MYHGKHVLNHWCISKYSAGHASLIVLPWQNFPTTSALSNSKQLLAFCKILQFWVRHMALVLLVIFPLCMALIAWFDYVQCVPQQFAKCYKNCEKFFCVSKCKCMDLCLSVACKMQIWMHSFWKLLWCKCPFWKFVYKKLKLIFIKNNFSHFWCNNLCANFGILEAANMPCI